MKRSSKLFKIIDIVLIILMILPLLFGMALNVLTKPVSNDITIEGARIFFTVKMPLQDLPITESQINSWLVIISLFWFCLYMTHGITEIPNSKRQHLAEIIVQKTESLVNDNMGEYFDGFAPFIAAIIGLSAFSSLLTLIGLYPPTSDINIIGGWAILVFFMITYYKLKCGPLHYLKGFGDPVPFFAPFNVISEFATPVSMTFRHYGNVLSGAVISVLVATGLQGVSSLIFGHLPGFLGDIPFLQIGIPAILSVYFDLFSGCLQAFIFAMLTMLYVSGGFPADEYAKRHAIKNKNKNK